MGKPTMFAPNCCARCYGTGWITAGRRNIKRCGICGGTGKMPRSAYDTLPGDSEPRDPSEALPSNENVIDTPISGEPK